MPTGGIPKVVLKEVRYREILYLMGNKDTWDSYFHENEEERSVLCTPRHAPCATPLTAGVEEEECLVFTSLQRSVLLYSSTPCRGPGSKSSENHIKTQMWAKIFSDTFLIGSEEIGVNWEYHLKIPGNGGCGSFRSDSAAIIFNGANQQFPFFITEFENDGFAVHKDAVVVVAETAFEYNRMLTVAYYLSEDEVNATRLHIGLVNGTTIRLNQEADVASVLKIVAYLRTNVSRWIICCLTGQQSYEMEHLYPDSTRPSSAGLSASIDDLVMPLLFAFRQVFRWSYRTYVVKELLKIYYQTCGRKPESISLYQEGISNNQFKTVLELEISEINAACGSLEANYKLT
ncbi:10490_t:CDS:2 [Funneliformis mosseae]|uniref:10490_t:CDS:1 n=1 Tax=Funneliformis mosseae TaxID=27381 RepID=A0A9N9AB15_FUNMO|nr:10490_t:CDS:2 [Funneliformis mosseae]